MTDIAIKIGTKVKPTCDVILSEISDRTYAYFNEQSILTVIRDEDVHIVVATDYSDTKYRVPKSLFNKVFKITLLHYHKIEVTLSIICVESKDNINQYKICINGEGIDNFSVNHNKNAVGLRMIDWIEKILGIDNTYYDYLRVIDTYLER